ncbi:hypothetical protein P153DRAFT_363354 [Dothidotthia symphoricarpi CBS 119687]|uniref:Uncharacterized protein n=1 Tax=Dothidotthia symphoricarpi CBS 119687 TaxID=1392245 RepID=A0A6A6AMC4_9PLEO|nr:uncharacterized protein P153DRAFT_363354 [Dothidotthia symphoricarpi CBS 119687]KAF2133132.1 hypothetical protein P153DRAFT_363354 [Dothidotthia symphoricarpi CBS 119687]
MPTEQKQDQTAPSTKTQPWRVHWPPKTPVTVGEKHGFGEGETIQLEGTASGAHLTSLEKEQKLDRVRLQALEPGGLS